MAMHLSEICDIQERERRKVENAFPLCIFFNLHFSVIVFGGNREFYFMPKNLHRVYALKKKLVCSLLSKISGLIHAVMYNKNLHPPTQNTLHRRVVFPSSKITHFLKH